MYSTCNESLITEDTFVVVQASKSHWIKGYSVPLHKRVADPYHERHDDHQKKCKNSRKRENKINQPFILSAGNHIRILPDLQGLPVSRPRKNSAIKDVQDTHLQFFPQIQDLSYQL